MAKRVRAHGQKTRRLKGTNLGWRGAWQVVVDPGTDNNSSERLGDRYTWHHDKYELSANEVAAEGACVITFDFRPVPKGLDLVISVWAYYTGDHDAPAAPKFQIYDYDATSWVDIATMVLSTEGTGYEYLEGTVPANDDVYETDTDNIRVRLLHPVVAGDTDHMLHVNMVRLSNFALGSADWPNDLDIPFGQIISGALRNVNEDDDRKLILGEILGSPGFEYMFKYGSGGGGAPVHPDGNKKVKIKGNYVGDEGNKKISVYDYNLEAYVDLTVAADDFPSSDTEQAYSWEIPAPRGDKVSDGEMIIRLKRDGVGTPSNRFNIDQMVLEDNTTTSTSTTSTTTTEEESFAITAKSVILDFADDYGGAAMGIRKVEFYYEETLLALVPADYTTYETSENSANYKSENAFDTSVSKISLSINASWTSGAGQDTNQRLVVVFDTPQTFDQVIVNNYHNDNAQTSIGAQNAVIQSSTDEITSTVYGAAVSNATELFDGVLREYSGDYEEGDWWDEQTVYGLPSEEFTRSIVIDITDNHGHGTDTAFRTFEFKLDSVLYEFEYTGNEARDYSANANLAYPAVEEWYPFDKDTLKTGVSANNSYVTASVGSIRIIVNFRDFIEFDEIVVNNYHNSGGQTTKGMKNIKIWRNPVWTPELYAEDFGGALDSLAVLIYDGAVAVHPAVDTASDETLNITYEGLP